MSLVKPKLVAEALGITTDALKKRRLRGTKSSNSAFLNDASSYFVSDTGKVSYILEKLPPSVREYVERSTTNGTKKDHNYLMKNDFKYMRTIGRANERRINIKQEEIDRRAKKLLEDQKIAQLKLRENREPRRTEKNYCYWTNAYEPGNHWNSIQEYEDSKKKKSNSLYY